MYNYIAVDGYTFRSPDPNLSYYLVALGGSRYYYETLDQLEEAKKVHQRYSAGKLSLI